MHEQVASLINMMLNTRKQLHGICHW